MSDSGAATAGTSWRVLVVVLAMVAIYGITAGIATPVIALLMEARDYDRTIIGLNSAAFALGILVFSPFAPKLLARMGTVRLSATCMSIELCLLLAIPATDHVPTWFVLRFAMGAMSAGLFIASETWLNEVVSDHYRARVLAAYNAVMAISFAIGPALLGLTGVDGWLPFLAGAVCIVLALLTLTLVVGQSPDFSGASSKAAFDLLRSAPTLSLSVLLVAVVWGGSFALMPVYGVRSGLDATDAALLLTVMSVGGVSLQYPIGWLGDVLDRYVVLIGCTALSAVLAICVPFVVDDPLWLWAVLFVWGGTFSAIYTMSMAIAGQRFRGGQLANIMAAFGVMWGLGMTIGPATAGGAMDLWDPHGLPALLAVTCTVFVIFACWRQATKPAEQE